MTHGAGVRDGVDAAAERLLAEARRGGVRWIVSDTR